MAHMAQSATEVMDADGMTGQEIPVLIQRALTCNWRPESQEDYRQTYACAKDLLDVLNRPSSINNRGAGDQLSYDTLRHIFSLAIAAGGHAARTSIRDASRKFRCVVFVSQALWSDVTTLPTNPSSFILARSRAWWMDARMTLHLDNSNAATRGMRRNHIPDHSLLLTAFGRLRSLVVEHTLANLDFLDSLHRQRQFPEMEKLVLSTKDIESWGPLPLIFENRFTEGVPVVDAPQLRTLRLRTVMIHLPETRGLIDLRLSARTRGSRTRPRVWNKWPARMVHGLVARNTTLTVLHLVEVIRTEALSDSMPTISLPSLETLVICSPSAKEPTWVLETLAFPTSTYLGVHIGLHATSHFDGDEFYYALASQLANRIFRCVTGVSSLNLSGLLLSPEIRRALPLPLFDETESPLHTTEIAHTLYDAIPGAIDIFIAYQSSWIPETAWYDIYHNVASYVRPEGIDCIEVNAEYAGRLDNAISKVVESGLPEVTELRLWKLHDCIWETLVRSLTGWSPDEDIAVRDVTERMLELLPMVSRVTDCTNERSWSSRFTYELIEDLHRARGPKLP